MATNQAYQVRTYASEVLARLNNAPSSAGHNPSPRMQSLRDILSGPNIGGYHSSRVCGEEFYRLDTIRAALISAGLNREVGEIMEDIRKRTVCTADAENQAYAGIGLVIHAVGLKVKMEPAQRNKLERLLQN